MLTDNEISSARGGGVEELSGPSEAAVTCHLLMFSGKLELGEPGLQDTAQPCWYKEQDKLTLQPALGAGRDHCTWGGKLCVMGGKGFVSNAGATEIASRSPETGRASR